MRRSDRVEGHHRNGKGSNAIGKKRQKGRCLDTNKELLQGGMMYYNEVNRETTRRKIFEEIRGRNVKKDLTISS